MRSGETQLDKDIRAVQATVAKVKTSLIDKILALPDNPRITRTEDGKSFTVNSSDLGQAWSAGYHDFKVQHEQLAIIINKTEVWNLIPKLEGIIFSGKYQTIIFHPDVIEQLKGVIK
jgi:hypothetical protein